MSGPVDDRPVVMCANNELRHPRGNSYDQLCQACYRQGRRTGRPRSYLLVALQLEREAAREEAE